MSLDIIGELEFCYCNQGEENRNALALQQDHEWGSPIWTLQTRSALNNSKRASL